MILQSINPKENLVGKKLTRAHLIKTLNDMTKSVSGVYV